MYIEDGNFEATIYLANETFYVEKSHGHFDAPVDFSHIVYRKSDLIYNFGLANCTSTVDITVIIFYYSHIGAQHFEGDELDELEAKKKAIYANAEPASSDEESEEADLLTTGKRRYAKKNRRSYNIASFNTCSLALVADQTFYTSSRGGSNDATTTASMVYHAMQTSDIYTTTDFSGVGYGIQFSVAHITIYQSADTPNNPFASLSGLMIVSIAHTEY